MYLRRTTLLIAVGSVAYFAWQHPIVGRLLGGPEVVVNPYVVQEAARTAESNSDDRHGWLIVVAGLATVAIFVAAGLDRLRLRRQTSVETFVYQIPTSVKLENERVEENLVGTADADAAHCQTIEERDSQGKAATVE